MEVEEGGEQIVSKYEVVVPISGTEEDLETSKKSEDSENLERCECGLYYFSKYLPVEPPVANLPELKSPKTRKKNTIVIPYNLEITKLSPNFNNSSKVPAQSVTRGRSMERSAYSMPKSRLVEPSYLSTWKFVEKGTQMAKWSLQAHLIGLHP